MLLQGLLAALAALASAQQVVVDTPLGSIAGLDEGAFHVFRGIPYAEAPVRFEAAPPKSPWAGTLNATNFGYVCVGEDELGNKYGQSEDCLFANIWRPAAIRKGRPLPVTVFIHGGGFMSGTGNRATYWGDEFVQDPHPNVLVTFNYRLGIFGFYSSPMTGANFGIQDQQELLRWVSQNIAAFGGDPKRVTLVGQSAGAMSVQVHLVSPLSRGLFARAFLASPVGLHYRSQKENADIIVSAANAVGCLGWFENQLACLRDKPAQVLAKMSTVTGYFFHFKSPCRRCDNFLPWLPVVDGRVLPGPPLDLIRAGSHARVPVVVSTVRNESLAFVPGILHGVVNSEFAYGIIMDNLFKHRAPDVEAHYADAPDSAGMDHTARLGLILTDTLFTCYARYLARQLAKNTPTFLSTFMHAPGGRSDPDNRFINEACETGATCHSADLNWMFPQSPTMQAQTRVNYTEGERALASEYSAALKSFNYGASAPWVHYGREDVSLLWSANGSQHLAGFKSEHCNALEFLGFPQSWTASPAGLSDSDALEAPLIV